jgi:hypothetical protein
MTNIWGIQTAGGGEDYSPPPYEAHPASYRTRTGALSLESRRPKHHAVHSTHLKTKDRKAWCLIIKEQFYIYLHTETKPSTVICAINSQMYFLPAMNKH